MNFSSSRVAIVAATAALLVLLLSSCTRSVTAPHKAMPRLDSIPSFASQQVQPRRVDIWLPRQYFLQPHVALPVLYMHDGQNLFDPQLANFGVAWELDDTAQRLMDAGTIAPAIVVGIWSTPQRRMEYFPEAAARYFSDQDSAVIDQLKQHLGEGKTTAYLADEYLRFIVTELKPYIDRHYRTLKSPQHTLMAGSSMGGLISIYALSEYPQMFGAAAGVSTHWPLFFNNDHTGPAEKLREYLRDHLPSAGQHRIYFDFGTATLDQYYEVHQREVDRLMQAKGYVQGRDWMTRKYPGAEHNEQAWQARVPEILQFLLPVK